MSRYHSLLAAALTLTLTAPVWSKEAPVSNANSNVNSREVASALGGITNKTFSQKKRRF